MVIGIDDINAVNICMVDKTKANHCSAYCVFSFYGATIVANEKTQQ